MRFTLTLSALLHFVAVTVLADPTPSAAVLPPLPPTKGITPLIPFVADSDINEGGILDVAAAAVPTTSAEGTIPTPTEDESDTDSDIKAQNKKGKKGASKAKKEKKGKGSGFVPHVPPPGTY